MSLKFLDEAEAEKRCETTLMEWVTSAGYKGCYSADETRKAVQDAKIWSDRSETARKLMGYVETSAREILVVGMRGGYQCFDSTGTEDKNKAVVFIDLDGRLTNFVRQPHQLHFAPEDCSKQGVTAEAMDNRIALLHEFGHAKQWIENPLYFDNHFMQQTGKEQKPSLTVTKKVGDGDPLLNPKGVFKPVNVNVKGKGVLGETFAQAIQRRAAEVAGARAKSGMAMADPLINPDGGWLLTRDELDQIKPIKGYSLRIESDNIARHEWPICDELGIKRRLNYRDIHGSSGAKASQTSILLQRQGQKQITKQAQTITLTPGKCPYCPRSFKSNSFLNNHIRVDHPGQPVLDT